MILRRIHFISALFILFAAFSSCGDKDTYPVTPVITFTSLDIYTNLAGTDSVVLEYAFTDGDGDIGSFTNDSLSRDVFVTMYEMKNGEFVAFDDPFGAFNYRIPYLEPRGNNKSLKGDIRINIDYNVLQDNDTIMYELYMKDRAGHESNTISTNSIITRNQ